MDTPSNSRQLFLRYLLEELSPEERAEIDDALIMDQQFSDSFQETRCDLIDAYAADELPPEIRKRVEQAIFSIKDGASLLPVSIKHNAAPQVQRRQFQIAFLAFALAACVLLVVVFIHLRQNATHQVAKMSHGTAWMATGSRASAKPSRMQPSTPAANPPSAIHPSPRPMGVMAIAMPLGTSRGSAPIPIQLHRGIDRIEIQWPLSTDSAAPLYALEIASDRSSIAVLAQHGPLDTVGNIRVANFFFPVDKLPNGEYIFRLRVADASDNMPVAESSVRILH